MKDELWQKTIEFHGHVCPGIAVGFRAALLAARLLESEGKKIESSHFVIAHNDVCGLDGIQVVTGCSIGNAGLVIDNKGKQSFSFISKKTGLGIRLILAIPLWLSDEPICLHQKVKLGAATEGEMQDFFRLRGIRGLEMLGYRDEEMFTVSKVSSKPENRARLYPAVKCESCGEDVMTPWIKEKEGKKICLDCSGD
jgi:formylmethanofuran dehydrogenase subunit E